MLRLQRVTFAYDKGAPVLNDVDLELTAGGYYLVRGPSGAGKSTFMRLLCLLESPQSGQILYNDTPLTELDIAHYRREVAYVRQVPAIFEGSVRDNLLQPFSFKANADVTPPSEEELCQWLNRLLLNCIELDRPASDLSVGQAQRLCLLRSLLLQPKTLLMDEPTASLDRESADVVLDIAHDLHKGGMTVIMVSHSEREPVGVTHHITLGNTKAILS